MRAFFHSNRAAQSLQLISSQKVQVPNYLLSAACLSINAGGTPRCSCGTGLLEVFNAALTWLGPNKSSFGHEHLKAEVFSPHDAPQPGSHYDILGTDHQTRQKKELHCISGDTPLPRRNCSGGTPAHLSLLPLHLPMLLILAQEVTFFLSLPFLCMCTYAFISSEI